MLIGLDTRLSSLDQYHCLTHSLSLYFCYKSTSCMLRSRYGSMRVKHCPFLCYDSKPGLDFLYGFTRWGFSKQQIICTCSLTYTYIQITATTKAKNVKYLHFHSLSINKLDQENEASLGWRHVLKALAKVSPSQRDVWNSPLNSLIALKKRIFSNKSYPREKQVTWLGR